MFSVTFSLFPASGTQWCKYERAQCCPTGSLNDLQFFHFFSLLAILIGWFSQFTDSFFCIISSTIGSLPCICHFHYCIFHFWWTPFFIVSISLLKFSLCYPIFLLSSLCIFVTNTLTLYLDSCPSLFHLVLFLRCWFILLFKICFFVFLPSFFVFVSSNLPCLLCVLDISSMSPGLEGVALCRPCLLWPSSVVCLGQQSHVPQDCRPCELCVSSCSDWTVLAGKADPRCSRPWAWLQLLQERWCEQPAPGWNSLGECKSG